VEQSVAKCATGIQKHTVMGTKVTVLSTGCLQVILRYLDYTWVDLKIYRPMELKFRVEQSTDDSTPNFTPSLQGLGVALKLNFTKFGEINAPNGVSFWRFTQNFNGLWAGRTMADPYFKFGGICSRGSKVTGI